MVEATSLYICNNQEGGLKKKKKRKMRKGTRKASCSHNKRRYCMKYIQSRTAISIPVMFAIQLGL